MKKVLVISAFKDRYTGKMYKAGKIYEMADERVAEVKETDPKLIEVVGKVAEPTKAPTEATAADPAADPNVPTVEVPPVPEEKKTKK